MGPPPRARGRLGLTIFSPVERGTTPASAGTTRPTPLACSHIVGPPPRARGRQEFPVGDSGTSGTTPASAGTTRGSGHRRKPAPGPPPRARGRLGRAYRGAGAGGTTPASAGTTFSSSWAVSLATDHPRERGDDAAEVLGLIRAEGPPPRARGRHEAVQRQRLAVGTTPASAGTTLKRRGPHAFQQDHPRERGDDDHCATSRRLLNGPPPRARGRRRVDVHIGPFPGTTPASAGTTWWLVIGSSPQ